MEHLTCSGSEGWWTDPALKRLLNFLLIIPLAIATFATLHAN